MQRIHPDDLTGELLARSEFDHLKLPAKFEEDISYQMPYGRVHVAYTGDYLDLHALETSNLQARVKC